MKEKIIISRASLSDLEVIPALQKSAFICEDEIYNNYYLEPLKQNIESIRNDFETQIFLKAAFNVKIIGPLKGLKTDGYCWIGKLIVHQDFQNKGLDKRLMQEIGSISFNTSEFVLYTGHRSNKNIYLYESELKT